jgi:hypothetical protein
MAMRAVRERENFGLRKILLLALMIGTTSFVPRSFAQSPVPAGGTGDIPDSIVEDVRPEEPEVELPTVVLEYTAIEREELEIVLPDEDLIVLPELDQQLPEPETLGVESPILDFNLPGQEDAKDYSEAVFFTEGTIGGGSDNHLIGDIVLYKRGGLPLYQFRFSHEGIDGYGQNSTGTGYFDRREELSGSIELGASAHTMRGSVEYLEQETGLQDFSGAYSVVHRFLHGTGEYTYSFASPFALSGRMEGHSGSRNLGSQREEGEGYLKTGAALLYEGERFTAEFGTDYIFHQAPGEDLFHQGLVELGIRFFGKRFDVNTGIGLHYDSDRALLVPWNFGLQGVAGDRWLYEVDFGMKTERLLYRDLWSAYPLLDLGGLNGTGTAWKYGGVLTYTLGRDIQLRAGLSYEKNDSFPLLTDRDSRDPGSGLFPFMLKNTEILRAEAGFVFSSRGGTELRGGWIGRFQGEGAALEPAHSIHMELRSPGRPGAFTLGVEGEYTIDPDTILPMIDLELGYQISEGITMRVAGSDLAGPFYEDGRPWWGEYEQRGFNLTLKTEISL